MYHHMTFIICLHKKAWKLDTVDILVASLKLLIEVII